ncbi:MAG: hypothetical protein U1F98_04035 [Verrucomicrobiota bacterium]
MEPERDIEKQLRAMARERRESAGDDFELHPATRRLLQGEVARAYPRRPRAGWGLVLSAWLQRPQVLGAGMAVLMMGMLGIIMFANHRQTVKEMQLAKAEPPAFAPPPERSAATASAESATDKLRGEERVDRPAVVSEPEAPAVVAAAPPDSTMAGTAFSAAPAPGLAGPVVSGRGFKVEQGAASMDADYAALVARDAGQAKRSAAASAVSGVDPGQGFYFANVAGPRQDLNRAGKDAAGAGSPVLGNFQVQQNGSQIRVRDSDGSVYFGLVSGPAAVQLNQSALQDSKQQSNLKESLQSQAAGGVAGGMGAGQWSFRVSGRNNRLGQNVVFTANVVPNTNMPGLNQAQNASQVPAQSPMQVPWEVSNSRITGVAVVGETNVIEVDAVPAAP